MTHKFSHVHLVPITLIAAAGFIVAGTFIVAHSKTTSFTEASSALTTQTLKIKTGSNGLASISINSKLTDKTPVNPKPTSVASNVLAGALAQNIVSQVEASLSTVK